MAMAAAGTLACTRFARLNSAPDASRQRSRSLRYAHAAAATASIASEMAMASGPTHLETLRYVGLRASIIAAASPAHGPASARPAIPTPSTPTNENSAVPLRAAASVNPPAAYDI